MNQHHSPPRWTLTGTVARRGETTIDLSDPAAGLAGATAGDQLLGLELAAANGLAPGDEWLRGDDLVAVYEVADARQLRATAMWRWLAGPPAAWELVVSASTSLLESDPRVAVTCDVAAGDVSWARKMGADVVWTPLRADERCPPEAVCLLVNRTNDSVVVAVHPADPPRIDVVRTGDRLRIACHLFAATLEKGVLLRSRVRAAIVTETGADQAAAILDALALAPPPLTS